MSKKALFEIIIAALLVIVEVVVILTCSSGEALNAANADAYMTSLLAVFINIDVLYLIVLQIINSNWGKKN